MAANGKSEHECKCVATPNVLTVPKGTIKPDPLMAGKEPRDLLGKTVKIGFPACDPYEWMWVEVMAASINYCVGRLDSEPGLLANVWRLHDLVAFVPAQVAAIHPDTSDQIGALGNSGTYLSLD
jgi:hypothetical protein